MPDDRHETPEEQADRNLAELLQELRVAQTGVQVLFAFLLTVPFTQRFETLTGFERTSYYVTLLLACVAALLLIAPSAYHRVLFHCGDKPHIVAVASALALTGMACVGAAMSGAVVLISSVLYGAGAPLIAGAVSVTTWLTLWFVAPGVRRHRISKTQKSRSMTGTETL
jgi:hypothetical protein